MTFFTSENYSSRIIRIKGVDTTASYLVCGDNKNCLIDTGMGAGSLRTYIEKDLSINDDIEKLRLRILKLNKDDKILKKLEELDL